MTTNLQAGDRFPGFELPNHENEWVQLPRIAQPSLMVNT